MDAQTKGAVIRDITRRCVAADPNISPEEWHAFAAAQQDGVRSGPEIGERVPDFTLADQHGKRWSRAQLMGREGLLLVFARSAFW
ncbi:MAG: hypothetical protein U0587_10925 [Candidatus Binatia bacterium]